MFSNLFLSGLNLFFISSFITFIYNVNNLLLRQKNSDYLTRIKYKLKTLQKNATNTNTNKAKLCRVNKTEIGFFMVIMIWHLPALRNQKMVN